MLFQSYIVLPVCLPPVCVTHMRRHWLGQVCRVPVGAQRRMGRHRVRRDASSLSSVHARDREQRSYHPDHQACGRITLDAAFFQGNKYMYKHNALQTHANNTKDMHCTHLPPHTCTRHACSLAPFPLRHLPLMFPNASIPYDRREFYFWNLWAPSHVFQFDEAAMQVARVVRRSRLHQCCPSHGHMPLRRVSLRRTCCMPARFRPWPGWTSS